MKGEAVVVASWCHSACRPSWPASNALLLITQGFVLQLYVVE